jgi:hypothetical protein
LLKVQHNRKTSAKQVPYFQVTLYV